MRSQVFSLSTNTTFLRQALPVLVKPYHSILSPTALSRPFLFTSASDSQTLPPNTPLLASLSLFPTNSLRNFTSRATHANDSGSVDLPLIQSMQNKIKEQLDAESVTVKDAYGDGRHVRPLLRVKRLHAFLLKTHLLEDPFYATKIVRLYAVNNDINSAHHVFNKTSNRNVYLWNSMIRAFAQSQSFFNSISLFRTMLGVDVSPDGHTYACVIRACADNFDLGMLRRVHGGAVAAGLGLDPVCCSALVTAYSKLDLVHEARRVFNGITEPDLVLWNSLISGYGGSGLWDVGMQMFSTMRLVGKKFDGYTLAGLLVGVADSGVLSIGKGLHCLSQKSGLDFDSHVGSLLVSMYSRCKCMASAYRVFCSILNPDLVTWSALIVGYSQSGDYVKVLHHFRKLNMEDRKPDSVLVASVLASIARMANVGLGCEVHGFALRHGLELDVRVSSALIDMYSKCGFLQSGICVFRIMPERNIISYNSVILGFGLHGYATEAFKMFNKIMEKGLVPDEATFSSLLSACCHAGLVKDGWEIFRRMKEEFNIRARPEHYVSMVKLLGSSGELEEAYNLTQSLPEPVDKAILGALLSCCNSCGNSELAETVAKQLFASNPADNVYRVMLSNIYAGDGRWDEVKKLRDKMTGGLKKMAGLSWIESS